jgi:hypothetical protein
MSREVGGRAERSSTDLAEKKKKHERSEFETGLDDARCRCGLVSDNG